MKVVLDTNVIVSALANARGSAAKVLSLVFDGKLNMLYDNKILFEYLEVLSKKEFNFNTELINDLIYFIRCEGTFTKAEKLDVIFHDETNKKFYEIYMSGEAKYLITGSRKHFPADNAVIIPGEFLKLHTKQKP